MKTIKEIALEVIPKFDPDFRPEDYEDDFTQFIEAFLAEYLAQQEPVSHEYQDRDGKWHPFCDKRHYENTVADGSWPIRALYLAPPIKPGSRKVFICKNCEGVYADEPTSQCDCDNVRHGFHEGFITMIAASQETEK